MQPIQIVQTMPTWYLIFQTITTVMIVGTFIVYLLQLRAMRGQLDASRQAASAQNMLSLVDFVQAPHARDAREAVIRSLPTKALSKWSEADRRAAFIVCGTYDIVGRIVQFGLVPKEPIVDIWGPSIKECFEILSPFFEELQEAGEIGSIYWNGFQWLYEQATRSGPRFSG
jgi:hypothetical protein